MNFKTQRNWCANHEKYLVTVAELSTASNYGFDAVICMNLLFLIRQIARNTSKQKD